MLEENLFRVLIKRKGGALDRTWSIAPEKDVPWEGAVVTISAASRPRRRNDERFYGLGEKAGDLQRNGKRYEMRNLDAMGYNAASTDPLYKHIPFPSPVAMT
ncbi:galactose mutarotase-like protein [Enterobacter hormaechei subsp. xiangfangensis]|nr:galactose mutarotase-like protein [Enterobacter hormaechei subsp. xiangfangensis]